MSAHAHARVPQLEGVINFRDIGGYASEDGRTVRWSTLYRSGATHALTTSDLEFVKTRGVRAVIDFRSSNERRLLPSRLSEIAGIDYVCVDHRHVAGDLTRMMRAAAPSSTVMRDYMLKTYREIPYTLKQSYTALFRRVIDGHLPLVFGCTAGKDRTGVAAAMLLTALGVAHEFIYEDFLLTEKFYDQIRALVFNSKLFPELGDGPHGDWDPVLRVESAYLDEMFATIVKNHGSFEGYFAQELGVDAKSLEAVRARLLI